MQALVDIEFDELLKIVKKLPKSKLTKLKLELDQVYRIGKENTLAKLLLQGPTLSKSQLIKIAKTRKSINQWRLK